MREYLIPSQTIIIASSLKNESLVDGRRKMDSSNSSPLSTSTVSDSSEYETVGRGRYRLLSEIGHGSFGQVFKAEEVGASTPTYVAIKLERKNARHSQLVVEQKTLQILKKKRTLGIPSLLAFDESDAGQHLALVMDLLGPSLEHKFDLCERQFSLKTVLMLAEQMITLIEGVHSGGFLHQDIKPENFLLGLESSNLPDVVHLIDFGLAKKHADSGRRHICKQNKIGLIGTARYASINAHEGMEQSRRDDMEALGYVLLYFIKGKLPWQGLSAETRAQKQDKVAEKKRSTTVESLCQNLPEAFLKYMDHCKGLSFNEKPNYNYLRQLFRILFQNNRYVRDRYDWKL